MMELSQIIYGIAIILLSAFVAREKIREVKLTKQHGLKNNPERCAIHETKISQIQEEIGELKNENKKDHDRIFQLLDNVRERLSRVEARINGDYSK